MGVRAAAAGSEVAESTTGHSGKPDTHRQLTKMRLVDHDVPGAHRYTVEG
jgi:hypothetical protein